MSELVLRRESTVQAVRAPLIELVGVEKVYRTGKLEYRALRGVEEHQRNIIVQKRRKMRKTSRLMLARISLQKASFERF